MSSYSLVALSKSAILKDFEARLYALLEKFESKVLEIKHLNDTGTAVEYIITTLPPVLREELYDLSSRAKIDIVPQENTTSRHKKLAVFDMDSTLIQQEVIDMIAAYAGVEDQVSKVTEAAMRGELDFAQSLEERVKLLKGVPITVYEDIKKHLKLTNGAQELCTVLKQRGVKLAVLSGGFQPFVNWAKDTLNLDYAFANHLERR